MQTYLIKPMIKYLILLNLALLYVFTYYTQTYLITEHQIYSFYSTQLSYEQIESFVTQQKKWAWVGYVMLPVLYFLKTGAIALCVYAGLYVAGGRNQPQFKVIFPAVVKADMVFLFPAVVKMVWFTFQTDYTLQDIQYFLPGSLLSFFEPSGVVPWLIYPLQAINIFELFFWLALAHELKEYFGNNFGHSFQSVALSYGTSFVLWIVFVVFITINLA